MPSFPTFATTAHAGSKQDAIHGSVGSRISSPKFVDNAVHHAAYKVVTDVTTGKSLGLSRPTTSDFQVTLGKGYDYSEEVGVLHLTHLQAPGVNDNIPVFYNDGKLTTNSVAPLMLFSGEDRILPDTITTREKSTEVGLKDTAGRSLTQLGLRDSDLPLQAGQIVNVGLRTTDLAMRLFDDKKHSLNSVSLSLPYSGSRSGVDSQHPGSSLLRHSTSFVSKDFRRVTIPTALRFLARYDHYMLFSDRYGNFTYAPSAFSQSDRSIEALVASNVTVDPIVDIANKVTVQGPSNALNNNNIAQVDDVEMQKKDNVIKAMSHLDPTANTRAAARRSANQMLRLNRKAQSSLKSDGHLKAWDIQPGDVVDYHHINMPSSTRTAILEATHSYPEGTSSFTLISYDVGVEDLQANIDVSLEDAADDSAPRLDNSVTLKEYSAIGLSSMRVKALVKTRAVMGSKVRSFSDTSDITLANDGVDSHSGFLIGHRGFDTGNASSRGAIGTGLTPRLTGGSFSSTTLTVSSTTGFPTTGDLVINDGIHATYTGKTNTTFTGVSVLAPSSATIPANNLTVRLLRGRSHEIGTVKSSAKKVKL